MSFIINGTTINSIKFNNTDINTVMYDEEEVYSGVPAIYDTVKNDSSNVTESQWLEFVNSGCIKMARDRGETSSFIGKNVTLSNSVVDYYTSWKIADFNHDSSGNTVDLIQNNTVTMMAFGYSSIYSNSNVRSWIINTYLPGFSTNVKNKLQTMNITTNAGNIHDKIKLLSLTEVSGSGNEGSQYPIFASDASRIRRGVSSFWWLRSPKSNDEYYIWTVKNDGSLYRASYTGSNALLPAIRFA